MSEKVYTIDEIRQKLEEVLKNTPVQQVILFGSYAKNNANKVSDIDLILDTNDNLKGLKLLSVIVKIEDALKKPVDAFEKTEIIKNSKIDKEIKSTGVIVYEK